MKSTLRRRMAAAVSAGLVAGLVLIAPAGPVLAATDPGCTDLGGDDTTGTCVVGPGDVAVPAAVTVNENLVLQSGAHLDATEQAGGFTLTVQGDLTMENGSVIEGDDRAGQTDPTGGRDLTINVTGDMDMAAGSRISSDNNVASGEAGDVTIDVGGDLTMFGTAGTDNCRTAPSQGDGLDFYNYLTFGTPNVIVTPSLGAVISARRVGANASDSGGHIVIGVGFYGVPPTGTFTMERCSLVDASSKGSAGEIEITAGRIGNIDGLVLSESGLTGVPNQPRGGGPITVFAGCGLTVSDTGVISSRGKDPGADLVLLKSCEVLINGVVQSTAPAAGHVLPVDPANRCNDDTTAHPVGTGAAGDDRPVGYTGCVRILGQDITIDATLTHNGNVNVDGIRAPMAGWIDIFSTQDTTILGDPAPAPKWAVSANACPPPEGPCSNAFGGTVTIKAVGGRVATTGQAVLQAHTTAIGGNGGAIIIEAGGSGTGTPAVPNPDSNVDLDGSFIEATGPSGDNTAGGSIKIRSFNGSVIGAAPGHLDASGDGAGNPGSVRLESCDDDNLYGGTVTPAPTVVTSSCGGAPVLPGDAADLLADNAPIWTACEGTPGTKSGQKWNDANGDGIHQPGELGLPNWTIKLFLADGTTLSQQTLTDGDGNYTFTIATPGTYVVCEVLKPGWTQTYPNQVNGTVLPNGETIVGCTAAGTGPKGYKFTIANDQNVTGNDFGNRQVPTCPEDLPRGPLLTRTVKPGSAPGGGGVAGNPTNYQTVQEAYDAALASTQTEVIGLFSKTTENVVLDGDKALTITQCTSAQITADNDALPVWEISNAKKLLIIGPDSVGGTIGWHLITGGHELKSIRSNGASEAGVRIDSNGNTVSFNNVASGGIGVEVLGSSNTLKSGTLGPNTGAGVHFGPASSYNTVSGATIQANGGGGVRVEGSFNTVSSNKILSNSANGILVAGTKHTVKSNQVDSNTGDGINVPGTSNTFQDNKVSKNTGDGFDIIGASNNLKSNASNNGSSGGSTENGGAEFRRAVAVVNGGSNKADGTGIPSAAKCSTFFTSATTCE